jgi:hypothetical protein
MATIYEPTNGVNYNAEEAAANSWPAFKQDEPLTNAQLEEIRAKAADQPAGHFATQSRDNAARVKRQAEQIEARRQKVLAGERKPTP